MLQFCQLAIYIDIYVLILHLYCKSFIEIYVCVSETSQSQEFALTRMHNYPDFLKNVLGSHIILGKMNYLTIEKKLLETIEIHIFFKLLYDAFISAV